MSNQILLQVKKLEVQGWFYSQMTFLRVQLYTVKQTIHWMVATVSLGLYYKELKKYGDLRQYIIQSKKKDS